MHAHHYAHVQWWCAPSCYLLYKEVLCCGVPWKGYHSLDPGIMEPVEWRHLLMKGHDTTSYDVVELVEQEYHH